MLTERTGIPLVEFRRNPESFGVIVGTIREIRYYMHVHPVCLMTELGTVAPAAQRNMKDVLERHWPQSSTGRHVPMRRLQSIEARDRCRDS